MTTNKRLLFVQGGGAGVHDEWDNKLVESLRRELGPEYEIHYPRMPNESDPTYTAWKPALQKELGKLDDSAILVGHSLGATVLINLLGEKGPDQTFGAIVLIAAPFIGNGGWPSDDLKPSRNLGARLPKDVPIHFYQGTDDDTVPASHLDLYARAIPQARVHRLPGRDHQLNNDLKEVSAEIKLIASED